MAEVTVVITCFNHGGYLSAAIESVLCQPIPFKLIVVDDGSTDGTAEVAARYLAAECVWQDNAGLSAARNTGLWLADTRFVLFLDADDVLCAGALASAVHCIQDAGEKVAFAYGGFREIADTQEILREQVPSQCVSHAELLFCNQIVMHGTVIYDTKKLLDAGGFDTTLEACEDYDIYLRLSKNHDIACYPTVAAEYRRHGLNMSFDAARMLDASLQVLHRNRPRRGAPAAFRRAFHAGVRNWREIYGELLARQIGLALASRAPARAIFRLVRVGVLRDPAFPWRLGRRALRKLLPGVVARKVGN